MSDVQAIDARTGEVVPLPGADRIQQLETENAELKDRVERLKENLDIELEEKRKLKARLSAATGERNRKRELNPFKADADEAWALFTELVKPKAREFDAKRFTPYVERRKGGLSRDDGLRAIRGAAAVKQGRCAFKPRNLSTYCEFATVFRDAPTVSRYLEHYDEAHGDVPQPECATNGPALRVTEDQAAVYTKRLQASPAAVARLGELRGWTPEAVEACELGLDEHNLVTFPVRAAGGDLVGMLRYQPNVALRRGPKLKADAGSTRDLFPPPERVDGDRLLLVEGEPDAVAGATLGFATIAVPGAAKWDDRWVSRLAARPVAVCFDCDGPGRKAAEKAASKLAGHTDVRVVDLDPGRGNGYDIGDLCREPDARARLERLLADAEPIAGRTLELAATLAPDADYLERVLDALVRRGAQPKRNGTGSYMVRCPAHDDRQASLSISENSDGHALLHCFAGCDTVDVLRELGLEWSDIGKPR